MISRHGFSCFPPTKSNEEFGLPGNVPLVNGSTRNIMNRFSIFVTKPRSSLMNISIFSSHIYSFSRLSDLSSLNLLVADEKWKKESSHMINTVKSMEATLRQRLLNSLRLNLQRFLLIVASSEPFSDAISRSFYIPLIGSPAVLHN